MSPTHQPDQPGEKGVLGPFRRQEPQRMECPMECPECDEQMDLLDTIVSKVTGHIEYYLYICHNPECVGENLIYNNRHDYPERGDPSGIY